MYDYKRGLVSVVIGLFDVSRFLEEKRLGCVLNQTWRDLEIILVNDGSTDDTPRICKELAANDSRIVLVDKQNGGLGSARNAGLDVATGEFVWFYDVDDEVELDLVEKNVRWMGEYGTDMVVFGNEFIYPETGCVETTKFKERLLESNDALKSVFMDELLLVPNGNGFVWNKFYRREFIELCGARFGEQRIQQDELFNLKLYPSARRVFISPEILYHYYIYNSGNNRSRYIPDRIAIYESIFDGICEFKDRWNLEDGRLEGYSYRRFYQGIDNSIKFNTFHHDAPAGWKWRRQEVLGILSRPKVIKCLDYIASHNNFTLEGELFFKAYRLKSFPAICFLRTVFSSLRRIKHRFSK